MPANIFIGVGLLLTFPFNLVRFIRLRQWKKRINLVVFVFPVVGAILCIPLGNKSGFIDISIPIIVLITGVYTLPVLLFFIELALLRRKDTNFV